MVVSVLVIMAAREPDNVRIFLIVRTFLSIRNPHTRQGRVSLRKGDFVDREHGLEAFLDGLPGVETDRFIVAVGRGREQPQRPDVAVGHVEEPSRQITRLLHA